MKNCLSIRSNFSLLFALCFFAGNQTLSAAQDCDTLVMKTGETILVNITKENRYEIFYRKCRETRDWVYSAKRRNVSKVGLAAKNDFNQPSGQLKLSGPRMGAVFFTGNTAKRIKDPSGKGGLGAQPVMSQFGYQFETAYLNNNQVQALFEFIPNITGLDQGKFLPSFSLLHGLRFNQTGWEFIVGPIFYMTKREDGFFDENDEWVRLKDWREANPGAADPLDIKKGLDERGNPGITTSFLISVGKNFRSGDLNFPVNIFAIPHSEGARFGLSVGFNKQK